jgi:hypothetical protein
MKQNQVRLDLLPDRQAISNKCPYNKCPYTCVGIIILDFIDYKRDPSAPKEVEVEEFK